MAEPTDTTGGPADQAGRQPPGAADEREAQRRRRDRDGEDGLENAIALQLERTAARPSPAPSRDAGPADPGAKDGPGPQAPSVRAGDVPDPVRRRYYSEASADGAEVRFFTDARTPDAVFRDMGQKIATRVESADVVRDLVEIAKHRGWEAIDVQGSETFRRQAWLEAQALGLEVRGYKPSERDGQELERRAAGRPRTAERAVDAGGEPKAAEKAAEKAERPDYDAGVRGKLLETGSAPYRHRSGQELTPFVRIETADGKGVDVWGVGLPAALEKSGAKPGDYVTVKRDGVERVIRTVEVRDKETGELGLQRREVPRNVWKVEAERFREASPAEAARDPALRNAQSRLAVVEAVVKDRLDDPAAQRRVVSAAKERIADHLERGAQFVAAKVGQLTKDGERTPDPPRERTRGR